MNGCRWCAGADERCIYFKFKYDYDKALLPLISIPMHFQFSESIKSLERNKSDAFYAIFKLKRRWKSLDCKKLEPQFSPG